MMTSSDMTEAVGFLMNAVERTPRFKIKPQDEISEILDGVIEFGQKVDNISKYVVNINLIEDGAKKDTLLLSVINKGKEVPFLRIERNDNVLTYGYFGGVKGRRLSSRNRESTVLAKNERLLFDPDLWVAATGRKGLTLWCSGKKCF